MQSERIPVLVGVGQVVDRAPAFDNATDPLSLMAVAARRAAADCFASLLQAVDRLDMLHISSWTYDDPAQTLAGMLGLTLRSSSYGEVGGETPVALIHHAAKAIMAGESEVTLVCGAEAQYAVAQAQRRQQVPQWPKAVVPAPLLSGKDIVHPLAAACGLSSPAHVYPLYEVAHAAAEGLSMAQAQAASSRLYAGFSKVAAANPFAWRAQEFAAQEVAEISAVNRIVAWPYPVRMVANPLVNQGAAVLVTSLARALEAGTPESKLVYVASASYADEPRDFMARDQFARSHAQDAVLGAMAERYPAGFDALELYSCFPCVPKMAVKALRMEGRSDLTVTGGLSFFGAPLSNYMLHAAASMVERLRTRDGTGLLYGQGEFVTKHHALALTRGRPEDPLAAPASVQGEADQRRDPVPPTVDAVPGPARVEAATVLYRRDGAVRHGVVVLRLPDGARTVAVVPGHDGATLAAIMCPDGNPVGLQGHVQLRDGSPVAEWKVD